MTQDGHSDEELKRRWEVRQMAASNTEAADILGISEASVRRSLKQATRRGLTDGTLGGALPSGYTLGKVTSLVGPDGTVMEWQHRHPDAELLENLFEEWSEKFKAEATPLPPLTPPDSVLKNMLALYPIVDVHLGQYSWAKETGENYDLDIAREQFLSANTSLYQMSPACGVALIVVLGDFFHADNNEAQTRKSHNHLDVDGRHDKVLHLGAELLIWHIDMAAQRHETVIVKVMRGNHDEYASKALTLALYVRYQNNPRVHVERSPMDLWCMEWGITMLGFTHGDNVKAEDMPGVMAAFEAEMWGRTTDRYGFSGHYHRRKAGPLSDEKFGAVWEIIMAFTAKDAWNRSMGHASKRGLKAMFFDKEKGRKNDIYEFIR